MFPPEQPAVEETTLKPSSPLKAREIEALTFVYSAAPAAPRSRGGPRRGPLRGLSIAFGVGISVGLLMMLAWAVLPI